MIINDTPTLQKHISVNGSIEFNNLQPYLKSAERKFIKPIIGPVQLKTLSGKLSDKVVVEALELAREAVANFGLYLYLPVGAVQISDLGIYTAEGQEVKTATDKQFKELQRSFKSKGHEALDELLELMEESPDKFGDWVNSQYHSVYKELLVYRTSIFNQYHYIFNSRQTFMAIKPTLNVVEDQFIEPVIGFSLLDALKADQTITQRKQAKKYLQQAIVAFTVMKVVDNGMFVFDAKGIHMRFDELPYEKTSTNINLKINDFLLRTRENKQSEGEEYLKKALDIIENNATQFAEYETNEVEIKSGITNTQSIVGF